MERAQDVVAAFDLMVDVLDPAKFRRKQRDRVMDLVDAQQRGVADAVGDADVADLRPKALVAGRVRGAESDMAEPVIRHPARRDSACRCRRAARPARSCCRCQQGAHVQIDGSGCRLEPLDKVAPPESLSINGQERVQRARRSWPARRRRTRRSRSKAGCAPGGTRRRAFRSCTCRTDRRSIRCRWSRRTRCPTTPMRS